MLPSFTINILYLQMDAQRWSQPSQTNNAPAAYVSTISAGGAYIDAA